jgi:hypothetical protein
MQNLFSRTNFQNRLGAAFTDPAAIQSLLGDVELPDPLRLWLTRLMLLYGVPINYLVPDEGTLPPESIRFFYLDMNWVDALIDGAFSIGRNLTPSGNTASQNVDRAVIPKVRPKVNLNARQIRAKAFGLTATPASLQVVSGFLLRSSVVASYPGIGVNAYPQGGTPSDQNIVLLPILRLQQLGPAADTIICLVDGDAYQVDVHEPPEQLHYGIDSYACSNNTVQAQKIIHTFTRSGSNISLSGQTSPLDVSSCFRTSSPRTMMMGTLAGLIAALNNVPEIDSAELGFEMNEGVGMVSFIRRTS